MRKQLHERWAWADIWCLCVWWLKKQKHATAVIKSVKQLLFSALMSQFNMLSLFAITLRCNINNSVDYLKCCSFGISFCGCRETAGIWPCLIIVAIKKVWNKTMRHTKRSERSLSVFETPLFITLPHSLFFSLTFLKWKLASHHLFLALLLVSPFYSQQGQNEVFPTYSHCVLCFSRKNSCSGFGLLNICFLNMRLFLICCKMKQIYLKWKVIYSFSQLVPLIIVSGHHWQSVFMGTTSKVAAQRNWESCQTLCRLVILKKTRLEQLPQWRCTVLGATWFSWVNDTADTCVDMNQLTWLQVRGSEPAL